VHSADPARRVMPTFSEPWLEWHTPHIPAATGAWGEPFWIRSTSFWWHLPHSNDDFALSRPVTELWCGS
jgi:hypothetical protein